MLLENPTRKTIDSSHAATEIHHFHHEHIVLGSLLIQLNDTLESRLNWSGMDEGDLEAWLFDPLSTSFRPTTTLLKQSRVPQFATTKLISWHPETEKRWNPGNKDPCYPIEQELQLINKVQKKIPDLVLITETQEKNKLRQSGKWPTRPLTALSQSDERIPE